MLNSNQEEKPFWLSLSDYPIFCGFKTIETPEGEVKKVPINSLGDTGLSGVIALKGQGRAPLKQIQNLNPPHLGISLVAPIEIQGKYLVCLDFDWKRSPNKEPEPEQKAILEDLMGKDFAYEESYSGLGAHIWMLCDKDNIPEKVSFDNHCNIEVFSGFSPQVSNIMLTGKRYQGVLKAGFPNLPKREKPLINQGDDDYFGTASKEDLLNVLLHIPNHGEGVDYETWLKVGMILKTELGKEGFDLWDEWSQHSDKYRPTDMLYKWNSFRRNEAKFGSLVFLAQKYGYVHTGEIKPIEKVNKGWFTLEDMDRKLGPINWMVEDFFEENTLSIIWGDTQAFKSFIALELCYCIAAGIEWHGKGVNQGPVLYVCGEGSNGIARRLAGLKRKYGAIEGMPLFISNGSRNILEPKEIENILEYGKSLEEFPKFIVFDTLNRNFTGDENSSKEVATALNNLEKISKAFKCSVSLIHHGGKDGTRIRGSSAWQNGVDCQYEVKRNGTLLEASLIGFKMKDAELPETLDLKMKIVDISDEISTLVTERIEFLTISDEIKVKKTVKSLLLEFFEREKRDLLLNVIYEEFSNKQVSKVSIRKELNSLIYEGVIERKGKGTYCLK